MNGTTLFRHPFFSEISLRESELPKSYTLYCGYNSQKKKTYIRWKTHGIEDKIWLYQTTDEWWSDKNILDCIKLTVIYLYYNWKKMNDSSSFDVFEDKIKNEVDFIGHECMSINLSNELWNDIYKNEILSFTNTNLKKYHNSNLHRTKDPSITNAIKKVQTNNIFIALTSNYKKINKSKSESQTKYKQKIYALNQYKKRTQKQMALIATNEFHSGLNKNEYKSKISNQRKVRTLLEEERITNNEPKLISLPKIPSYKKMIKISDKILSNSNSFCNNMPEIKPEYSNYYGGKMITFDDCTVYASCNVLLYFHQSFVWQEPIKNLKEKILQEIPADLIFKVKELLTNYNNNNKKTTNKIGTHIPKGYKYILILICYGFAAAAIVKNLCDECELKKKYRGALNIYLAKLSVFDKVSIIPNFELLIRGMVNEILKSCNNERVKEYIKYYQNINKNHKSRNRLMQVLHYDACLKKYPHTAFTSFVFFYTIIISNQANNQQTKKKKSENVVEKKIKYYRFKSI